MQTDSTFAYVSIKSSSPGQQAFLDGKFIGETPVDHYAIAAGEHTVLLRRTATNSWMMTDWTKTFAISAGDTLEMLAQLKRPYSIKSEPYGAEAYLDGAFRGTTPLIIELPDTAAFVVTLLKEGFRPTSVNCNPEGSQFISTILWPDQVFSAQKRQMYELAKIRKGRNGRKALIFTGLTLASGVAAILLNGKADDYYDKYLQAGDPQARERFFDRTETYDTYSSIAMGLFQVNLGISLYLFYKSQR